MITVKSKGDYKITEKYFRSINDAMFRVSLEKVGEEGVAALMTATPKRTGKTANSWSYEIQKTPNGYTVYWVNSNTNKGENVALLIQLGHGTRRGGYVRGVDYINPALKPVFDKFVNEITEEVRGR